MRLILGSVLFSTLAAAICSAQYNPASGYHAGGQGGFHGGVSGIHYTGSGVGFANPGFGNVNSLPPPASGISAGAWRQIQRSNHLPYSQAPFGASFAPYYYPSFGYSDSSYANNRYDAPPPPDPGVQNMMMTEGALTQQIQRLTDRLDQLTNAQQRDAAPQNEDVPQTTPQVPITLVLRNGQQIQVQNYAVMDHIFWDFTRQPARKIPVSSIDISASTRATEATGAEFPQLGRQ
ncbi:MAG: hypothetical protein ACJ74Z_07175 [Bryobacteraceae bacterium]